VGEIADRAPGNYETKKWVYVLPCGYRGGVDERIEKAMPLQILLQMDRDQLRKKLSNKPFDSFIHFNSPTWV
jgi:hypothetical protein